MELIYLAVGLVVVALPGAVISLAAFGLE